MANIDEKKTYPIIFTLTDLTGKQAQTGRTTVMWGTEVPRRYVYLTVAGFFPGMLAMAITAPFLGVYAFGAFAFVIISIIVLVEWRSRTGLKQRLYKTVCQRPHGVRATPRIGVQPHPFADQTKTP